MLFVHPLYASAVYSDAASGRRRELHKRLADLVADPEEQARHLALGSVSPDAKVAAKLETAAGAARARGAWDAGGELLELARDFTAPTDPEVRRQRTVQAAEYHIHAGDRVRARALLEAVLVEAPPGPVRAEALRLLAEILYNVENYAAVPALLDEALDQAGDPELECMLEVTLSYVYCHNLLDFGSALGMGGTAVMLIQMHFSKKKPS